MFESLMPSRAFRPPETGDVAQLEAASVADLHARLADPDPRRRADAACVLGDRLRCGELDALPDEVRLRLRELLGDEDLGARLEAAIALAEAQDQAATDVLIAQIGPTATRLDAVRALGALGDQRARPALLDLLGRRFQPWADRLQAAAALCRLGERQGSAYLEQRLRAWRQAERAAALHFVGESRHPRGFELLSAVLADERHPLRDVAVRALGLLGDPRARPLLEALAARASGELAEDVAQALRELERGSRRLA